MARVTLRNSPKFALLARRLKIPMPYVRGHLEMLWDAAHETGNPIFVCADAVEAAIDWQGEPGAFVAAATMVGSNFLDALDEGRFEIHDYWHHAPSYVETRRDAEEERRKVKTCEHCGTPYHSEKGFSKFCCDTCRKMAHKVTHGDESVTHGDDCMRHSDATPAPSPLEIKQDPPLSPPREPEPPPPAPSPTPDTRRDAAAPDADGGGVVMEFPCRGKRPVYQLREADLAAHAEAYPGIDVPAEFAKALAWLRTNPTRRKTCRGMPAFLNNWLSRCADRPRGSPQGAGTRGGPARFTPRSAFDESVVRPEDRRFVE